MKSVNFKVSVATSLILGLSVLLFQNCGGKSTAATPPATMSQKDVTNNPPAPPLTVAPESQFVPFSATVQIVVSGGTQPYAYTIEDCDSWVDPSSGLFTAAADTSSCVVVITDQSGQTAYEVINVGAGLTVTATPNPVKVNQMAFIDASGGVPPYTYQVLQGAGTMTQNVYFAPGVSETAVISVTDSSTPTPVTTTVSLQVLMPANTLASLTLADGTASCPPDFSAEGQSNPSATGLASYFRNETLCTQVYESGQSTILSAVQLAKTSCPTGFTDIGVFNGGSLWLGHQYESHLCIQSVAPASATQYITNLYIAGTCTGTDESLGAVSTPYSSVTLYLCESITQ